MPNDASQRTWGNSIKGVLLCKQYGERQCIVWRTSDIIYLSFIDIDGANWSPKKITKILSGYSGDDAIISTATCAISDSTLIIYVRYSSGGNPNVGSCLIHYNLVDGIVQRYELDFLVSISISHCFFDLSLNKIFYSWVDYQNRLYVAMSDFNGSNSDINYVYPQTFSSGCELIPIGNKLVYFFKDSNAYINTAISDLDCSNFVKTQQAIQCLNLITIATDGTYAYSFFAQNLTTSYVCKVDSSGANFTYTETDYFSYTWGEMFILDSIIYLLALGYFAKYSTTLSYIETGSVHDGGENVWYMKIDPSNDIYAWTQESYYTNADVTLDHLWTYPGNGPITPTTVQCQVTDMLIDASTGKTITPLIGGV